MKRREFLQLAIGATVVTAVAPFVTVENAAVSLADAEVALPLSSHIAGLPYLIDSSGTYFGMARTTFLSPLPTVDQPATD